MGKTPHEEKGRKKEWGLEISLSFEGDRRW